MSVRPEGYGFCTAFSAFRSASLRSLHSAPLRFSRPAGRAVQKPSTIGAALGLWGSSLSPLVCGHLAWRILPTVKHPNPAPLAAPVAVTGSGSATAQHRGVCVAGVVVGGECRSWPVAPLHLVVSTPRSQRAGGRSPSRRIPPVEDTPVAVLLAPKCPKPPRL